MVKNNKSHAKSNSQYGFYSLLGAFLIAVLSIGLAPVTHALDLTILTGAESARGTDQAADLFGQNGIFTTLTNVLLFLVGAISVIMIIIGGFRYVVSGGDSSNITSAKNTILYAIVGLIVSMLAYAAISFVIDAFAPGNNASNF